MEPGIAAAAYTVETAVEGAAAGAFAIARSTVPLKARFYRLPAPSPALKRSSHTLNVIKGRAYIFGGDGDAVSKNGDNAVHIVTLPADLDLIDTDYQSIPAVAIPPTPKFDEEGKVENKAPADSKAEEQPNQNIPSPRAGHCASVIGDRIYIFGGSTPTGTSDPSAPPNSPLDESGKVYTFDTITKTWEVLTPNKQTSRDGFPTPRNYATSSSTIHPLPIRTEPPPHPPGTEELMTDEAKLRLEARRQGADYTATDDQLPSGHGTVFLHGGYDSDWNLLRDQTSLMLLLKQGRGTSCALRAGSGV
jgi:Kelch motif